MLKQEGRIVSETGGRATLESAVREIDEIKRLQRGSLDAGDKLIAFGGVATSFVKPREKSVAEHWFGWV